MKPKSLTKYAWLSIAAAISTIILKLVAFLLTRSVGLLSDAIESTVNLVAAIFALSMLKIAEKPPDENHMYGHTKAEYFSSITEGILILLAAIAIIIAALERFLHPRPIEQAAFGLLFSIGASFINLVVAIILLRSGNKNHSITLQADAHHLLADVYTSAGVVLGVILVVLTNWQWLDPLIALFVGINIIFTGYTYIKKSVLGFMDTAIPKEDKETVITILNSYCKKGVKYHGFRSRQSAKRQFVSVHILVPGSWTVQEGHDLLGKIENEIQKSLYNITVFTHLEPMEDPKSSEDISIESE